MRARELALVACAALCACDPELRGERGDWTLVFPGLQTRRAGWPAPHLLLAGARVCPVLRCETCPEDQCNDAAIHAAGPVVVDLDGCFRAEGPGEVVWTVDPPCVAAGQEPDRAVVRVLAPADVDAAVVADLDQFVAGHIAAGSGSAATTASGAWIPNPPWPLRLVAGAQVRLPVELTTAAGEPVAFDPEPARVVWTPTRGRAPVAYPGAALEAVTFAGSEAETRFELPDRSWPLGPVLGVDPGEAASLDLAAALDPDGAPMFARALARDAAGEVLHGAPVTWSVDERALAVALETPNLDHVSLADCRPPEARGGPREAVLRARWRGLEAALTLRWTGVAGEPDPNWGPPDPCTGDGACGCRGVAPGALAPALLVPLALRRRRRRADAPPPLLSLALRRRPADPPPSVDPRRNHMSLVTCLLLPVLTLSACADPPALRVAAARELGALAWERDVQGRDGGYSARVGERSVWVFGDTGARKSPDALPGFLNNTACSTADLDARDGLFPLDEHRDAGGYPHEFIPLTADERAHELAHGGPNCGDSCEGVALWPGPVVPDPERGRVFVFYAKLLQRPGPLNITMIGTSLAVWGWDLPEHATRPEVAPGSDEPTLLFRDGEVELAAAALVHGEHILAYACDGDGFDRPCRLARAPLADPLRRAAWEFYARGGGWTADPRDADVLFDGAPMMTVHHKPERDLYLAVYAAPGGTEIELRTAPAPWGPWSDAATIHHPLAPLAESAVYGALFHPELAQDGGAVDYLTYYLADTGTIQLVEIAWHN